MGSYINHNLLVDFMTSKTNVDKANVLLEILGRNSPSIDLLENTVKLLQSHLSNEEVIKRTISNLHYRFQIDSRKIKEAYVHLSNRDITIKPVVCNHKDYKPSVFKKKVEKKQQPPHIDILQNNINDITILTINNVSAQNVADLYCLSEGKIRSFLIKNGIDKLPKNNDINGHWLNIQDYLNKKISIVDIASIIEIDVRDLELFIKASYERKNDMFFYKGRKISLNDVLLRRKKKIISLYKKDFSVKQIAETIKVNLTVLKSYIYNHLLKDGSIKTRKSQIKREK